MVDKSLEVHADSIDPTVQGTSSVLKVARRQKTVKKVVIVSSFLALMMVFNVLFSRAVG
jgi:hypothetical protein